MMYLNKQQVKLAIKNNTLDEYRSQLIVILIRNKYSVADELAIQRKYAIAITSLPSLRV